MIAATAQFSSESISIRRAQAADIEVCRRICYEAFTTKDTNKRKEEKYYLYLDRLYLRPHRLPRVHQR
jgi:hypothetical protein